MEDERPSMKFAKITLTGVAIASLLTLGVVSPATASSVKMETECSTIFGGFRPLDYPTMSMAEMAPFTPCNVNVVPELQDLATVLYDMGHEASLNIQMAQNVSYSDESYDEAQAFYQLRAKRIVAEMIVGVISPSLYNESGKLNSSQLSNIESLIGQIYAQSLSTYQVSNITQLLVWHSAYLYEALGTSKPIYDAVDAVSVKANGSIKVPLIKGKIATGVPFLKVYVELLEESDSFAKFVLSQAIYTKFYTTLGEAIK